jgi:hypothetical protein
LVEDEKGQNLVLKVTDMKGKEGEVVEKMNAFIFLRYCDNCFSPFKS